MPGMERSPPAHPALATGARSRVDQYYASATSAVAPASSQATKRQRPQSTDEVNEAPEEPSTQDMLKEILLTVRRLDTRVEDLDKKIGGLEEGLSFASNEIAILKLENIDLKAENVALTEKVDAIEDRLDILGTALDHESEMRDAMEANSRLINLEISGIPKSEGETRSQCKEHVLKVLTLIGSENGASAVDVAHRKMSGGIIVKFRSRCQRDEVYLKRFNLVGKTSLDLGFNLPTKGNFIYINESLSFDRARLMKEIRDKLRVINNGRAKELRIKSKTSGGVILVQNKSGNFVRISSIRQFNILHNL